MFGDRIASGLDKIRSMLRGTEDETDQELAETRKQLEESDHPAAKGEEVDYGPGPRPDLSTLEDQGYDDGDIRVSSTSEIDVPDDVEPATTETEQQPKQTVTQQDTDTPSTNTTTEQTETTDDTMTDDIDTDTFWGQIADAALTAEELEENGHERAAEALLEEIQEDIDAYTGGDN